MNIKTLLKLGLLMTLIISQTGLLQAQGKAKIILTGGTNITDIGPGCEVSINLMKDAFDYVGMMTGIEMDYTFCTGNNFNKNYILQTVAEVEEDLYDVIVLFNSSHGFNYLNSTSRHTFFVAHPTAAGSISQEEFQTYGVSLELEIFKTLKKKGAPTVLVFSESCNVPINIEVPAMYKTMNPNIGNRLKELFLSEPAHIISSSSEYGQYSYTDNKEGGIYVNSLLHAMNDVTTKCDKASWDKVMALTQQNVEEYAKNLDGGQTAIYDINDATPITLEETPAEEDGYIQSGIRIRKKK